MNFQQCASGESEKAIPCFMFFCLMSKKRVECKIKAYKTPLHSLVIHIISVTTLMSYIRYSYIIFSIQVKATLMFCFCCMGLTNPNCWQTEILILISYINISFFTSYISSNLTFFFQSTIKYRKNKNLVHLILLNLGSKETWLISYVTCVDIIAQVF